LLFIALLKILDLIKNELKITSTGKKLCRLIFRELAIKIMFCPCILIVIRSRKIFQERVTEKERERERFEVKHTLPA